MTQIETDRLVKWSRGVLSLISIQSTPVTTTILLAGYASVTGTIFNAEVIPLLVMGATGHWGFFALNDLLDYERDRKNNRELKPLVSGDIELVESMLVTGVMITCTVYLALIYMPGGALFSYFMAIVAGTAYNINAKNTSWSPVYLGVWGMVVALTGGYYAGEGNLFTIHLAMLVSVHMFWMVVVGDMKELDSDEESLASDLGCEIEDEDGYEHIFVSGRFMGMAIAVLFIQVILILFIPVTVDVSVSDIWFVYLSFIGSVFVIMTFTDVLRQKSFDRDTMKKDIAKYEAVTILVVLVVSASIISVESVLALILGTVVWGMSWQTVLYSHPLKFP